MPLFKTAEEWNKAQKEKRTKQRLLKRQSKLVLKYRRGAARFREDSKIQLELRRVAALCLKLDVHLLSLLHDEIIKVVMES